ncbi:hypothetical protein [Polaromonas sp.]|uniref:hypothetical protein n=1 Tax=Polaromonas sp. TaxID=1869339 RepID=UPI002FC6C4C4
MSTTPLIASLIASPNFLRRVLWADAATGVATGLLQVLAPGFLAGLLGIPHDLLLWSGLALFAVAAFIAFVATRQFMPGELVWLVIGGNVLWVIGCLALLLGGLTAPTLLGQAFIVVQAVTVGVLAELEFFGLRRQGAQQAW